MDSASSLSSLGDRQVEDVELTLDLGNPITGVVRTHDGSHAIGVFVQVAGGKDQPRICASSYP